LTARTTGAPLARSRRLSMSSSRGCAARSAARIELGLIKALVEHQRDILKGRDFYDNAGTQHDLYRALRRHIGRVRDGQRGEPVGRLIREDQHLAQEALRE
jgi:hypothetical protein